jgi:hypothetical protein
MSYSTAISELRQLIADTEFNKKATKKKLIGSVDGSNTNFVTYDKRIYGDSLEVFVNDSPVGFTLSDSIKGEIVLDSAPDKNTKIQASYYWMFWIDDELINFLNKGAESTGQYGSTSPDQAYLNIEPGLKAAALYFAGSLATRSLAAYIMNRRHSEEFLVEQDGNNDTAFSQTISAMNAQAKTLWDQAIFHRDDFYKRLGKRNKPAFAIKLGSTRRYGAIR